jgi:CBS-domain-containing membrane protein
MVNRRPKKMISEVLHHWKNYIFQSLLATLVIFVVFLILGADEGIIIASIGASTFIVFALPEKMTARTRNIIGGHFIGIAVGALCHLLMLKINGSPDLPLMVLRAAVFAFAVGLAMFLMVVLDCEHPPAAGTSLGIAMEGFSMEIAVIIMLVAALLSIIRYLFKKYLHDLA